MENKPIYNSYNDNKNIFINICFKSTFELDFDKSTSKEPFKYIGIIEKESFIKKIEQKVKNELSKKVGERSIIESVIRLSLDQELKTIKYLLRKHLEGKTKKATKDYLRNKIQLLLNYYLEIEKKDSHKKYLSIFKCFFSKLFIFLKSEHGFYWPKINDPLIDLLVNEKSIHSDNEIIEPPSLKFEIFSELASLKDEKGKNIFHIEQKKFTKADFKKILAGDIEEISEPINVLADEPYKNFPIYIIGKLIKYIPIEKQFSIYDSPFLINGRKITATMSYTAKNRLKTANKLVKERIKDLFLRYIS